MAPLSRGIAVKNPVIIFATALTLSITPALAAAQCQELCDPAFYQSATGTSVRQMIDSGANVNARDAEGKTPLHWAASATPETIAALLLAGADVHAIDQLQRAPLHFISATGSVENITLLINAGADVNARTANDWTPLHGVAKFGPPQNIAVLINAGADASIKNEMGETPYDLAGTNQRMQDTDALVALKDAR